MSDIKVFQFITGQSIIGKVISETEVDMVVDQPLTIRLVEQHGGVGVGFVPYDPINPEGQVKFYKAHIMSEPQNVPSNMVKAYQEQTSRIQIVSALDQMEGMR